MCQTNECYLLGYMRSFHFFFFYIWLVWVPNTFFPSSQKISVIYPLIMISSLGFTSAWCFAPPLPGAFGCFPPLPSTLNSSDSVWCFAPLKVPPCPFWSMKSVISVKCCPTAEAMKKSLSFKPENTIALIENNANADLKSTLSCSNYITLEL